MVGALFLVVVCAALSYAHPAFAQQGGQPVSIEPATPLPAAPVEPVTMQALPEIPTEATTLEPYVDGLFDALVKSGRIPGAAVVIVRNGEVALKKGYGFSNLETRKAVDPDATLFRMASLSKMFTATVAMQLVEAGKLDLNSDVNVYLDEFKIASRFPEPVTLAHLLTHTAGFDDRFLGIAAPADAPTEALGAHLAHKMPERAMPVGRTLSYSNYGYALAGHIAERVGGVDFRSLVKNKVFDPLGMTRSQFGVPFPIAAAMALPYRRNAPTGALTPGAFDQVLDEPAGNMVATANDMGLFMLSALGKGPQLLTAATTDLMQTDHFTPGPTSAAWTYGFASGKHNGVRWIGHGGAWPGYAAQLRINRETQSGFFFVLNTDNQADLVQPITVALSDRLWSNQGRQVTFDIGRAKIAAQSLAGSYIANRRVRGDFILVAAGAGMFHIAPNPDGSLTATTTQFPRPLAFQPVSDGVWEQPELRWRIAAHRDGGGDVDGILLDADLYERVGVLQNFSIHAPVLIGAIGVLALGLVWWLGVYVMRKLFNEPAAAIPFAPRVFGYGAMAAGLFFGVGFLAAFGFVNDQDILMGRIGILGPVLAAPYVLAPLAAAMLYFAAQGFGRGLRARLAQVSYALILLATILILMFSWAWNLHLLA
jgi:CubicO group peptidase (beta-lactamase class C family)